MAKVSVQHLGDVPLDMIKIKDRYRVDKGEIDLMAVDLEQHGQIQPIVVNSAMELLAGERRCLAARKLGWEKIRAEMRTGDDKIGEKEVELSENTQRKQFTWAEVAKLEKAIFDMKAKKDPKWSLRKQEEYRQDAGKTQIGMRIQLAEALELLPELGECETQDEAWKKYKRLEEVAGIQYLKSRVPDAVRRAPQWAEEHYIVGDALEQLPKVEGETANFAEVDPPYGIDLVRRKSRNKDDEKGDTYNEIDVEEFPAFMRVVIGETYRILKPNSFAVFWFGMQWHAEMLEWLEAAGFAVNPLNAIWYKGPSGQTAQPDVALASVYEPFFLARKGQPKMLRSGRANVFHYPPLSPNKKIHLTEKPQDLLCDILDTICFPGSSILVPFLGSGATLRAAYSCGHTGFGFDLNDEHKQKFLDVVAKEFGEQEDEDDDEDDEDMEEMD